MGKKKKKEKEGGKGEERGDDGSIQSGCGERVAYGKERVYGYGITKHYSTITARGHIKLDRLLVNTISQLSHTKALPKTDAVDDLHCSRRPHHHPDAAMGSSLTGSNFRHTISCRSCLSQVVTASMGSGGHT